MSYPLKEQTEQLTRLIERLVVDASFRAEFRRDPIEISQAYGLDELAEEYRDQGNGIHTLELRESKLSLAGVVMAIAAEGIGLAEVRGMLGHGAHGPGQAAALKALRGAGAKTPSGGAAGLAKAAGLHGVPGGGAHGKGLGAVLPHSAGAGHPAAGAAPAAGAPGAAPPAAGRSRVPLPLPALRGAAPAAGAPGAAPAARRSGCGSRRRHSRGRRGSGRRGARGRRSCGGSSRTGRRRRSLPHTTCRRRRPRCHRRSGACFPRRRGRGGCRLGSGAALRRRRRGLRGGRRPTCRRAVARPPPLPA